MRWLRMLGIALLAFVLFPLVLVADAAVWSIILARAIWRR